MRKRGESIEAALTMENLVYKYSDREVIDFQIAKEGNGLVICVNLEGRNENTRG